MLHLTTAAGERLEIPPACVIALALPEDHSSPSAIFYDFGLGPQFDMLGNAYGIVKRGLVDCGTIANPIELRVLGPTAGGRQTGRLFLSRERISARREVLNDPQGLNARLLIDVGNGPAWWDVADTLDELDGITPPATPEPLEN